MGNIKPTDNFKCINDANAIGSTKLDDYLANVDKAFCSADCVCNIKNVTVFKDAPLNTIAQWSWDPKSGALNFGDCTSAVRNSTYVNANVTPSDLAIYSSTDNSLDMDLFLNTWKWVENTYSCVGFCDTTYQNNLNLTVKYYKYQFSDVNRGIPKNNTQACFGVIFDDTVKFFSSNGLYILLASIFMFLIFIVACAWCCAPDVNKFDIDNNNSRSVMINPSKV